VAATSPLQSNAIAHGYLLALRVLALQESTKALRSSLVKVSPHEAPSEPSIPTLSEAHSRNALCV
jgi:hypothetical protein